MNYETVLTDIGLSAKEAQVYLASLSLGPSTVQSIARKAQVARGTTYVVLDQLMRRGLMTKLELGKRTKFVAEPPRHLLRFVDQEERALKTKRQELEDILPELQALLKASEDKPTVRYFEGLGGIKAMLHQAVMECSTADTWYNLLPWDHILAAFGTDSLVYTKERVATRIPSCSIFTTRSAAQRRILFTSAPEQLAERRFIPPTRYRSASGLTIYRDRIAVATYAGSVGGILIESPSVASMGREAFEVMWEGLPAESSS